MCSSSDTRVSQPAIDAPVQPIALSVPLDEWEISPKIDFITLRLSGDGRNGLKRQLLLQGFKGNVCLLKEAGLITIHDPTIDALQFMIDFDCDADILGLETALDFRPKGAPAGADELAPLFRWISDCLWPGMHGEFCSIRKKPVKAWQVVYNPNCHRYVRTNGISNCTHSRRWENWRGSIKGRLYIKDEDSGKPVSRPSVRLEITANRGGCYTLGLQRIHQLREFGSRLRTDLSPFFKIACGGKPSEKRRPGRHRDADNFNRRQEEKARRAWETGGAMALIKGGFAFKSDTSANKRIGKALDRLGKDLQKLQTPQKKPAPLPDYETKPRVNPEKSQNQQDAPIGGEQNTLPRTNHATL